MNILVRGGGLALLVGGTFFLLGCRTPSPQIAYEPLVPGGSTFIGGTTADGVTDYDKPIPPAEWWKAFRDAELNRLIASALKANLTVKQLASRMKQAAARKRQAGARLFPTLDATAAYSQRETNRLTGSEPSSSQRASSVGALLDWEIDVWGKLSAASRAADEEAKAARHDWLGGQLLLTASVSETYLEILEHRQLLQLLNEQVEVNETLAKLTELRFGQGQASIVDILQQRGQLKATQALFPDTEATLKELEFILDVLSGKAAQVTPPFEGRNFPRPIRLGASGTPSDLLKNRPDLLASQARIAAIDYRVAEAVADRLPRFSLGAALNASGAPSLEKLVSSLVAGAVAPVIDGGERRAEVDLRKAQLEEAIEDYSQRYLEAIGEVETALVRETKQAEHVRLLENQLQTAQKLLTETRNRYRNGLTDYLPVLAAIQSVQRLERELISNKRIQLSNRVAVHRALGGQ